MNPYQEHPCIDAHVDPLLGELREAIQLLRAGPGDPHRRELESFIRDVFREACGARIHSFFPDLLAFLRGDRLCAVVGCRGAADDTLFAEQYLDDPAEQIVADRLGRDVAREYLVEVGNLGLAYPGQARAVIAATTAFLAAAGYRWVIFTAARPLFNAFRRLGLRPVPLAPADAGRLTEGADAWGRYYDAKPQVYAGDILAGLAKLSGAAGAPHPHLRDVLAQARKLGASGPSGLLQYPSSVGRACS